MIKATVTVMPKTSILDPQGEAVKKAMHNLGMSCIQAARVGKHIDFDIEGTNLDLTKQKLEELAKDLLSNPVVEDYQIEIKLAQNS